MEPTLQQRIQTWLKDNQGGHTPREIADGINATIGSVRSYLPSMAADGYVLLASNAGPGKNKRYAYTTHCNPAPDRRRPPRKPENPEKFMGKATKERQKQDYAAKQRERAKPKPSPASRIAYTGYAGSGYQHISIKDKLAAALASGQRGIDSELTARQIKAAEYHVVKG